MEYIITTNMRSRKLVYSELSQLENVDIKGYISVNVLSVETNMQPKQFYEFIIEKNLIFIRHIMPVIKKLSVEALDKHSLEETILHLCYAKLEFDEPFDLQIKNYSNKKKYNIVEIESSIVQELTSSGYRHDKENKTQVVSLVISSSEAYFGCNEAYLNISTRNAGEYHLKINEDNSVSRAEGKLIELFGIYELRAIDKGIAIDLGAAPGGWSHVLSNMGYIVHAIDPGDLHERLQSSENIIHYKESAQEYLSRKESRYCDLIVNDMKMEPYKSWSITLSMAKRLSEGGIIIMTVKLPKNTTYKKIQEVVNTIKSTSGFKLVFARQLFHNRSEFTVIIKKGYSNNV